MKISPAEIAERLSVLQWQGERYVPDKWGDKEIMESRRLIRTQIFIDRGGRENAISDFGSFPAAHYHELINRHRTPEGSMLRWLSYQPEVCALLTVEEHEKAHNTETRNALFQIKYEQYGYDDVRFVVDLINELSVVKLGITLPPQF